MPTDTVVLQIDGQRIERFLEYTIEADIYTADDAFSLELANPEVEIKRGQKCELWVNNKQELTGVIDKVSRKYSKAGLTLRVEGRDLMGLLVDSYCEQFVTVQGMQLSALAEMLLKTVPFINRKKIVYQENIVGKLKGKKKATDQPLIGYLDTPQKLSQIEPGMTVFEVLRNYAASRGLMFFLLPDGTFVFGRPKAKGEPVYSLICTLAGEGNNVLEGEEIDDISKRYSKITVIGQQQGQEDHGMDATQIHTKATAEDKEFPFYKPFVTKDNNDSQSPALHARFLKEQQRHQGYQLRYQVQGHSQNSNNWQINELCRVRDEVLGIDGVYLIYGRTMERSRQSGTTTSLKLGPPGLVQ
ncbi:MAG: phage baseplate assembly protein [Thermodesulfobacteriota bacterium]